MVLTYLHFFLDPELPIDHMQKQIQYLYPKNMSQVGTRMKHHEAYRFPDSTGQIAMNLTHLTHGYPT